MNREKPHIQIGNKKIGRDYPVLVVAEVSANHNQSFEKAKEIVKTACELGVGAVKLQTYTPDTLTLDSKKEPFVVKGSNPDWEGKTLYQLYQEAYMSWEWHKDLKKIAESYGVPLFSTAYDDSSVDFLENLGVPAHKVASFELTDFELLKKVAKTGKPVILSRGMSTLEELQGAVFTLKENGASEIAILHCVSSYPAKLEDMNLATIPDMEEKFKAVPGLSDHTLGNSAAIASVALGACIIEKHFTLKRSDGGADSSFSLEPQELKELIESVKEAKKAVGKVSYEPAKSESAMFSCRRSLWFKKPVKKGQELTLENVGRFRPGQGLAVKFLPQVLGKKAKKDIDFATPLSWDLIE